MGGGHCSPAACTKSSPAAQRTGSLHRKVTKWTTGGYPETKGTDPETELLMEQRCRATAHVRSALVVVCGTPILLRADLCWLHSPHVATPRWRLLPGDGLAAMWRVKPRSIAQNATGFLCQVVGGFLKLFALAGCRRHCAIMIFWRLGAHVQTQFTLGRRVWKVTALCAAFNIGGMCVGAFHGSGRLGARAQFGCAPQLCARFPSAVRRRAVFFTALPCFTAYAGPRRGCDVREWLCDARD